jgi:thiamine biosynthesis lipoprotein
MIAPAASPARPAVRTPPAVRAPSFGTRDRVSVEADLMGGRVSVHVRPIRARAGAATPDVERARRDAGRTIRRIAAWADRLTRFTTTSELSRLNAHPASTVRVGPTLAAVLGRAAEAGLESGGLVDPTLLDARLAAEWPADAWDTGAVAATSAGRRWAIESGRRGGLVSRAPGVRFDLGGVAKGWIADRAAAALAAYPAVLVDADGDLAISLAWAEEWRVGVADPRDAGTQLAVLQLAGLDPSGRQHLGLATSGTSVHRWEHDGRVSHHLIDPRTGRPAVTDVVQATVLADSASAAEVAAKSIVIMGSEAGEAMLERPGIRAVIVLTARGVVLASPSALRWLV